MNYTFDLLSDKTLLSVLTGANNAVAIHVTRNFNIQYASDAMIAIWGKDNSVIGKPLEVALPELEGQPFISLFEKVWDEGITITGTDTPADLYVDGQLQTFYFDFEYRAIKDGKNRTYCILHTATDVTARFIAQQREQSMAEELRTMNEELSASNEELHSSLEELNLSQQQLKDVYESLVENNALFRNMVRQAPVGICIIDAKSLIVQEVNDSYLELVGKQREDLEKRGIWEAVAEAKAYYKPIMDEVIRSGVPFTAKEAELILIRSGIPENVFVDFVYEPVTLSDGSITAIMVLAIDVTDKVISRRSVEEIEERVRLAVEAADIGTFDLDLVNRIMLTSDRFNSIFGFDEHVDWKQFIEVIHPDDQEIRSAAHKDAYKNGRLFYEVRVIYKDFSIHWIRVQGQVYHDKNDMPVRVLGTLLDITEYKRLQQQKDDFISIASHELKTPITSLKASLQLLDRMKDKPTPMFTKLIDQSNRSMDKISTLVDDLLKVSRANETELKLNKTTFNINEMLDTCCNHVRIAGKYTLHVQGDKQLDMHADRHAIDQVLINLVNNAVKYAPDSKDIYLVVEKLDDVARISVKDSGPGISPDKIPHLFERYFQVDASGYRSSGLGLGLYISSEIIKRHGGDIGVESELGEGSIFWFTVPLEK